MARPTQLVAPAPSTFSLTGALAQSRFVSILETHGNFHELLAAPGSVVTLRWLDAAGRLVFTATCGAGASVAGGIGPFDNQMATCSRTYHRAGYKPGTQTLVVRASGTGAFHGKLVVNPSWSVL